MSCEFAEDASDFRPCPRFCRTIPNMRFRKLRVTWSVLCAAAFCIFFVMWVRSYWAIDHIDFLVKTQGIEGNSDRGQLWLSIYKASPLPWVRPDNSPPPVFRVEKPCFEIHFGSIGGIVYIPHRYLVVLAAVCSFLPWIHWSKRFTLRTLLLVTTVIAVLLGAIMWLARH